MRRHTVSLLIAVLFAGSLASEVFAQVDSSKIDSSQIDSSRPVAVAPVVDSVHSDSIRIDLSLGGFRKKRDEKMHAFVLTGFSNPRQVAYHEDMPFMDFNRVTGFYLGVGSIGMQDFGPHDELGINTGIGYGFADKRWEYLFGAELRLPLTSRPAHPRDTTFRRLIYVPPTLAIGGEIHNMTSTSDAWRAGRTENALYAFFAREDFRDYYKLAGWMGYLAFRPFRNYELRAEWRSDHYQSLSQNVFYGRWGGNKVLPPNPPVGEGRMNSLVLSSETERVHDRLRSVNNLLGDSVYIEQLQGISSLLQVELGHMPGSDFGFNRYLWDVRRFDPILNGLSLDTRLRFEASTGDAPFQKLEFLGGPGSLPALYRKSIEGNRMLLLNTEVRISVNMLTALQAPDLNIVIYNDFGKMGYAGPDTSIFKGFDFHGISSILYNVGVGIGWTQGIQFGVVWRTDIHETPRILFRLERPF